MKPNLRKTLKNGIKSFFLCIEMRFRRKQTELLHYNTLKLIKPNAKYKDIHKGKRCFIIGNGPSLKKVNLESLKDEITFTVNQSPRIKDFAKLHTNYHIWTDEHFFNADFSTPEGKELLQVMKSVNTEDNRPTVFYKTTALKMIKEQKLEQELNISYLLSGFTLKDHHLYLPIDRAIPGFETCVHYQILIAVYMGFSEIYLLGCDCTSILTAIKARLETNEQMEYAYECTPNEIHRIKKIMEEDSEIEIEFLFAYRLFLRYKKLEKYCARHGVKLYNATQGSLLEGIERVKLEDILARPKV